MQLREARDGPKVLASTLLAPAQVSAQDLKALYAQRWNVELDLRNIKTRPRWGWIGWSARHQR